MESDEYGSGGIEVVSEMHLYLPWSECVFMFIVTRLPPLPPKSRSNKERYLNNDSFQSAS